MKKQHKTKHRRCSNGTAEIHLLKDMSATLARMEERLDAVGDLSIKQGAMAGAATGGLVSVVVSVTLLYLKMRHGV
ncbi:hypothetical protein [Enterobacter ludwigii]|uniref:hypothetical protein n=1 Tax=Enterobacter ludwigii TaxID=299767 RepID=UPI0013D1AE7F|nr:hypothetical protein [Enterobacter ludwigii]